MSKHVGDNVNNLQAFYGNKLHGHRINFCLYLYQVRYFTIYKLPYLWNDRKLIICFNCHVVNRQKTIRSILFNCFLLNLLFFDQDFFLFRCNLQQFLFAFIYYLLYFGLRFFWQWNLFIQIIEVFCFPYLLLCNILNAILKYWLVDWRCNIDILWGLLLLHYIIYIYMRSQNPFLAASLRKEEK